MKDVVIIIPARYGSTRFPGKPLVKIAGIEMLKRVADIAKSVTNKNDNCTYFVATDDDRIVDFCRQFSIPAIKTLSDCNNGTERCAEAVSQLTYKPKFIINLQGDNPLCPPDVVQKLIDNWQVMPADVLTPYIQLDWYQYARLLKNKQKSPFSGTTVLVDSSGFAMAFSKNIIPAIRNLKEAQKKLLLSPVKQHIGLYGYTYKGLAACVRFPETLYEQNYIEGLEQMRFLENGLKIKMVAIESGLYHIANGVDCLDDVKLVEKMLIESGELDLD